MPDRTMKVQQPSTSETSRDASWISKAGILGLMMIAWHCAPCVWAAASPGNDSLQPLNRFPRMVHEYFVEHVRRIEEKANRQRAALKTRADAEAYIRDIREKTRRCFGPWPDKTPLNPRTTGIIERDTYKIEKVIFESRPGFLVTANLYVPKGHRFPLPGVVGTCGHSTNGKAAEAYQSFAQGLARQGYVVLIYDPIGQGERLQYPDQDLKSRIGVGVYEHLYAGNQQFLVSEFFGSWRAWDGIRALDYLLTRQEVDPNKIGVTGNSGGGTMTTWLCALEDRWTMAAPSCFVTTFRRNTENELPADTEQCPPHALALGLDHADFLAAMAPEPIIILAKEEDFFDIRGTEEAYSWLKHLYKLLGAEQNIALFTGPGYHAYSHESREAMYRWFNRVTGISDSQTEPELIIEKDETLWCTPNGQVCQLGSRPIYSFTKEKSEMLARQRPKNLSARELNRRLLKSLGLRISSARPVPEYRVLQVWPSRKYPKPHVGTYTVETEPGIHTVVYLLSDEQVMSRPARGSKRAILYVAHLSSDAELRTEPLIAELLKAKPNSPLYACDVRGIGESQPNTCQAPFHDLYGNDFFYAIHSIMLDKPYIGQKTYDVLRVLDWLKAHGHEEVHLVGKGWGALPATFAAVLSDQVKQVTLKNALTSYSDVAESEAYTWPLSTLLPNVLEVFDLPDCYKALEKKNLRQIEPWGPNCEPIPGGLRPSLAGVPFTSSTSAQDRCDYFPPPESEGGWRKLDDPDDIRQLAGMDPDRLASLKEWLLASDNRKFAAVVIRNDYIVLEVERQKSSKTATENVKSCAKAICATVLAIASEESQQGRTPKRMDFDCPAFQFIPWANPLSDPRKSKITVKQLLNHTSGIAPESTGARNCGPWEYVMGHSGDPKTAKLAFDPGTNLGYSTHGLYHAALVCEDVTGIPYDRFAIEKLFAPIGVEKWWFEYFDGGQKYGRHPSHGLGMPARDTARIAYCMLHNGRWKDKQVIPKWFVEETAAPTHSVTGIKDFGRNAESWSHGWELPGRLTDGREKGIPKDARFKPGSGGQLIAFVPSLDLVVTRQTGSSGDWAFEEYLRLACQAVSQVEKKD